MTHSVDASQPLSPTTNHDPKSSSTKQLWLEGGSYTWAQQHGLLLTKDDQATATTNFPVCSGRDQHQIIRMTPFSGVISQLSSCQKVIHYIGLFPSWKGQHFILTGVDNVDTDFPSFYTATPAIRYLQNSLFTITVVHTTLLLIKELTAQQKKCGHGIHQCSHAPHHFEAAVLIEWGSSLLKTVTVPARQQYLAGLGKGPPEGCTCPELVSNT